MNVETRESEYTSDFETYAQATLGSLPMAGSGEHKILGVPWNSTSDQLIFNVSELAQLARDLPPTK